MSLEFTRPAGVEEDDGDFQSMLDSLKEGDEYMEKREFSDAESSYTTALEAAFGFYGALNPVVLLFALLPPVVERYWNETPLLGVTAM